MRLTKEVRDNIVDIVINKTFEKKKIHIKKQGAALFADIVKSILPKGFRTTPETDKWFPHISGIYFRFPNDRERFEVSGDSVSVPYFVLDEYHRSYVYYEAKNLPQEELNKLNKHKAYVEKMKDDKIALRQKIRAIVYSASTDNKLKEIWPDVEKYWKFDEPLKNLPAVINAGEINSFIDQLSVV